MFMTRIEAIQKLINIAKDLNGEWKPSWNFTHQIKWFIYYNVGWNPGYRPASTIVNNQCLVYFKSKELVEQVIKDYKHLLDKAYELN